MTHAYLRLTPSLLGLGALLLVGCSSDSTDGSGNTPDAGSGSGGAQAGTGGGANAGGSTSSGGTAATGGGTATGGGASAGGNASAGGASASGGASSGDAGTGGASAAGGAGSGGGGAGQVDRVPWGSCDQDACEPCYHSNQNGACSAVDNPCNEDDACEARMLTWRRCICSANGDTTAQAACDAEFTTFGGVTSDVVACVRADCSQCYGVGGLVCPVRSNPCQTCLRATCVAEITACGGSPSCGAALEPLGACACAAQDGTGSVSACIGTATTAGGAAAQAVISCIQASCADECKL